MNGAGWYIVETDPEKRQTLAQWTRYGTQQECESAIRYATIPHHGLLTARLWDGAKWI